MTRAPLALLFAPSLAAAKPIYLEGTQPGELDRPLEPVEVCRTCHGDYDAEDDYEPSDSWSASTMSLATRDPVFLAALSVAEQDRPDIGEYCLRCHTPNGWLARRATAGDGSGLDPLLDRDGITCDTCHRMMEGPFVGNAQYVIAPSSGKRGKFDDVLDVGHSHVVDPFTTSAELCGTCHHVGNPAQAFVLPDGQVLDESFPLETTYLEWLGSAFPERGLGCAECHMTPAAGVRIAGIEGSSIRAHDFRRHDFLGSNAWLGRAVSLTNPALGREVAFGAQAERIRAFLRTAATLQILDVGPAVQAGAEVGLSVRVTNLTGHKLPTGYADGRRMWLEVSVGREVVSGAYDEAEAQLAMTPPPKIWQAVHGNDAGPSLHLVLQDRVLVDNRIPPEGFAPTDRTAPVGATFVGHQDDVRLWIRIPRDLAGEQPVRVRLRHQVLTREYVEFLRDENGADDRGEVLYDAWSGSGRAPPEDLAEAETTVRVQAWDGSPPHMAIARGGACAVAGGDPGPAAFLAAIALAFAAAVARSRGR